MLAEQCRNAADIAHHRLLERLEQGIRRDVDTVEHITDIMKNTRRHIRHTRLA